MRFFILSALLLFFQSIYCQIDCNGGFTKGDYPPGCFLCDGIVGGNNIGYTPDDTINYDFPCGEVENSIWYTFMTSTTGGFTFTAISRNCKNSLGLEMAIYDTNFKKISRCILVDEDFGADTYFSLEESTIYYLLVDGIDGDECDFTIQISRPFSNPPTFMYTRPRLAKYCTAAKVCYRPAVPGINYEWKAPQGDSIVSGGGPSDNEICLWFRNPGERKIEVKVENPCYGKLEFSEDILIEDGISFVVDSIQSDKNNLCIEDEVTFFYDWKHRNVDATWRLSGTVWPILAGGETTDTFLRTKAVFEGALIDVTVSPNDECGVPAFKGMYIPIRENQRIDSMICEGSCVQISDSCYFESGTHRIDTKLAAQNTCDSLVTLNLMVVRAFPSPNLDCIPDSNGIYLSWSIPNGSEEFIVFVNRDSIATVNTNNFLIEDIAIGETVDIKIQPRGSCTYLPAEVTCTNSLSKTKDNFINNKIAIYPNPTTGRVKVETDLEIEEIEVFNIAGHILQKEYSTSFDLKNQKSGIYFFKIKTNEGVGVKRVLKN